MAFSPAKLVQRFVHCNPVNPGRQTRVSPEGPDRFEHFDKYFLSCVFGIGLVLQDGQYSMVHPVAVGFYEQAEGWFLSLLQGLYERLFVQSGG